MSDAARKRADEFSARAEALDAEFSDVAEGVKGGIFLERMLVTVRRKCGKWPDCIDFGKLAHDMYHAITDTRAEQAAEAKPAASAN